MSVLEKENTVKILFLPNKQSTLSIYFILPDEIIKNQKGFNQKIKITTFVNY